MGELKALLPWQGRSLISHQVFALTEGGVDRIVVVVGHRYEELCAEISGKPQVEWTLNPDYLQGKTTSIKAGLKLMVDRAPETLLLLNVDQPRSADTVGYLLRQHRSSGPMITIPTFGGKGGHPVVFDGALLGELGRISEEMQGIREVVRRHREGTLRVEMESGEVLWDLNTPEQYRAALEESK